MMRQKGWVARYKHLDTDGLRTEIRHLERSRAFIFEREEKLAYLENRYRAGMFVSCNYAKPGGITLMKRGWAA